ncbi:hypothetical protein C9I50_08960 [Pseudomonas prosekii]|nr:hypothetical protein C9I50_08960 [Pseudomonas prosekii]
MFTGSNTCTSCVRSCRCSGCWRSSCRVPKRPDATAIPVGARLAREGAFTDAKSFAGKPRSYEGWVVREITGRKKPRIKRGFFLHG